MKSIVLVLAVCGSLLFPPAARAETGAPSSGVIVTRDIEYGKPGPSALKMHLVRPNTPLTNPLPVVVYIYGGAWRGGSRDQGIESLTRLARAGYVGASIEYRHSQAATFPAQIQDCKCAIRFLRSRAKEFGLDPDKVGVWGLSSGGHLAALLGVSAGVEALEGDLGYAQFSSGVNAVVDWFGPTDFLQMDKFPGVLKHNDANSPESRLIGGPIQQNPEKAKLANPIAYVTSNAPPFLIMHGGSDPLVPPQQSQLLAAALKKAKAPVELVIVPGAPHGFVGAEHEERVRAFFDKHLKGLDPDSDAR